MRVATLATEAGPRLGVRVDGGWAPVDAADGAVSSLAALIGGGAAVREAIERAAARAPAIPAEEAELGLCVPNPGKIICVRLNYRSHVAEAKMETPERPGVLAKYDNSLLPAGEPLHCPAVAEQYDYEGELALVIGRAARDVPEAEALDHVWGYVVCNDVHARDLHPFHFGKTLDGFFPLGPELVSADEVGDPQDLAIKTWLNGELRQDSRTSEMVFGIAELISFISRYVTLEPGDIVATGTPAGAIVHSEERRWMRPGDVVEVEVEGLGRLVTPLQKG